MLNNEATYISGTINADSEQMYISGLWDWAGLWKNLIMDFQLHQLGEDAKDMCISSINPQKM